MANFDIINKIGAANPIKDIPEWPMASFDRSARILWAAIGDALADKGWTENQIKEWLQSDALEKVLDNELGDLIRNLGDSYADDLGVP